jgi:hypothetical protein
MKKKSARDIPNFSRAPLPPKGAPTPQLKDQSQLRAHQAQTVKPSASSPKLGRRGQ